jgi:hypothetical protein
MQQQTTRIILSIKFSTGKRLLDSALTVLQEDGHPFDSPPRCFHHQLDDLGFMFALELFIPFVKS